MNPRQNGVNFSSNSLDKPLYTALAVSLLTRKKTKPFYLIAIQQYQTTHSQLASLNVTYTYFRDNHDSNHTTKSISLRCNYSIRELPSPTLIKRKTGDPAASVLSCKIPRISCRLLFPVGFSYIFCGFNLNFKTVS